LLVSDVDDTLLGDDEALDRFRAATADVDLAVVLNSSRPVASVVRSLRDTALARLEIDGVIGALGTEIELGGERLGEWSAQFADFDREAVDAGVTPFEAVPHAAEYQTAAKASYAIAPDRWDDATRAVSGLGFPVRVITSGADNFDVIPGAAGKAAAVRHVAARLGVPSERVMTAGDSENDADMLAAGNAIVVGNATPGLVERVRATAFLARGFHADGVVEGLRHHGVPLATPHATRDSTHR
jgi:sucrose-phosphate synthase